MTQSKRKLTVVTKSKQKSVSNDAIVAEPAKKRGRPNKIEAASSVTPASTTKAKQVLALLKDKNGASIPEIIEATGWQAHSVRGFLSGTIRKKLKLTLDTIINADGSRRYRVVA